MIVNDNIFVFPANIKKTAGNPTQLDEVQLFIQVLCAMVAGHYSVELQNMEPQCFGMVQTVPDQGLTDVVAPVRAAYCKTGIGNMAAAAYIVGGAECKAPRPRRFRPPVPRRSEIVLRKRMLRFGASSVSSCGKASPWRTTSFQISAIADKSAVRYGRM